MGIKEYRATEEYYPKLFLNTYQRKTYKVVLVSVNIAKIVNRNNIDEAAKIVKESLDKVYNQCAVQFEITTDEFTLNDLTSFSHGSSGILTVYNDDQKRLLTAYEKEKKMQDKTYYLFFVDNVIDKKDGNGTPVSGYMPRGYNAGFIYDGGSERTIAHEIGHGVAGLEHVFENSSNSGKTANLMDYRDGEELWHFQWDQMIHRFGDVFAHFDIMNDATASIDNFINDSFQFVSVGEEVKLSNGKIIKMSAKQIIPNGEGKILTTYTRDFVYSYVRNQMLPSNGEIAGNNIIRQRIKSYITPSGMSDDVTYFDDVKLNGYVNAIDNYVNTEFEFIHNGDLLSEVLNGLYQNRASGNPQIYSKSEKTGKYRTTFDKLGLKRCLINCVLQATNNSRFSFPIKLLPTEISGKLTIARYYYNDIKETTLREDAQQQLSVLNSFIETCTELLDNKYVISPIMSTTDAHLIFEIIKK